MRKLILGLILLLASVAGNAAPLESCPTQAFLVQGSPARLYGVDLSTGSYRTLANSMSSSSVINALAFNFHDQYMYGWDKALQVPVRIGSNFQREPLNVNGAMNGHYYVGDVSNTENAYYLYRKGSNALHGLWKIVLDPEDNKYLKPRRIVSGSSTYLNIYDFAFHPDENRLYSVDSRGDLYVIDPDDGSYSKLGNVGERGTFGAVYFDVDGNFYISRNKDGRIFKIDLASGNYNAVAFAQGPSSSSNDGARCAFAPVVPEDSADLDFGDAPDSYGTSMAANGARHDVSDDSLRLGQLVDGEAQAFLSPDSDDAVSEDDEDGVIFVTSMSAGNQAIVQVEVQGSGNLNAWVDFDGNGSFDMADQIFDDRSLSAGSHNLSFEVPISAKEGSTWARFRLSSASDVEPTGGVSDGEVEDHMVQIAATSISRQYYPSASGFVTIAFEDLWPSRGDYDMNDFVLHYRTGYSTVGSKITAVSISGEILAMGATFHNGFAVSIDGLARGFIDEGSIEYEINGMTQSSSPLEAGQSNAVFVVADDLWDYVEPAEGCSFYRTESNCGESPIQFGFRIDAQLSEPVEQSTLELGLFNPFLFATQGYNRNSIFESPPGRPLEIHLKNRTPSDLADQALLGRADDRSNIGQNLYYQNENGLPWGLEMGTEWKHPGEYIDLVDAYPDFIKFVESEGEQNQDWYLYENAVQVNLYQE